MRCKCNGLLKIVYTCVKFTIYQCRRCSKQYEWTEVVK